jgi:hypothetical protein
MVVQEKVLLGAVVALLAMVLVRALHQAVQLARAEAQVRVLEQELVQARSAMVLAQAREWEFHRESGKAREME